jgi:hypothetical protein
MLKKKDVDAIKLAFEDMKKLDSVMVKLQSSAINLSDVRKLFDSCVKAFPGMTDQLSRDAKIVHAQPRIRNCTSEIDSRGKFT